MSIYRIALYPAAAWNEETETNDLGEPGETLATFEAAYPQAAMNEAKPTVLATRSETTQRMQRGKRVTLTTYRPADGAVMAWMTARGLAALVEVES